MTIRIRATTYARSPPVQSTVAKGESGSAKNIAAEVIEMTLKYSEPRFCDYSHEIQFGEIGEGDELTWRLIENEELGANVTVMNKDWM